MSSLAPAVHSVQFYDTHDALIDRLCGIACSGLLIGNSVLIVATEEHRTQLTKALVRLEVDVRSFAREQRFVMCDAEETLAQFMVDGFPDSELFTASVGKLLIEAKKAASPSNPGLTVFGEMVAVLWEQGNQPGALALERLWNDVLQDRAFHLHCAYPRSLFAQNETGMLNICETHSHVLGMVAPAA